MNTTIPQKIRRLREVIAERSVLGRELSLDERDVAPLIDAADRFEVRFLLQHLNEAGELRLRLVDIPSKDRPSETPELAVVKLTVPGWEAVSPMAGTGAAGTCFVAMSFDPSLDAAYDEGILPAVEDDCGFNVLRIDRVPHNDDITDRILAGIRTAQFVVADFSLHRQAVYFEAGFAAGLGRTVIWTCRNNDFTDLNFDTRQRNHIQWTQPQDLRVQLAERIRATVTLPARLKKA